MKKTIIALSVALISAIGFSAAADTTNNNDKKQNATCTSHNNSTCNHAKQKTCGLFDGINLSADQKAKLEALQNKCREKCTKDKADKKQQKETFKKKRLENRKNYLNEIKGILTPEQYVQFLENSFIESPMKGKHHKFNKKHDSNRKHRHADKNRQCSSQPANQNS